MFLADGFGPSQFSTTTRWCPQVSIPTMHRNTRPPGVVRSCLPHPRKQRPPPPQLQQLQRLQRPQLQQPQPPQQPQQQQQQQPPPPPQPPQPPQPPLPPQPPQLPPPPPLQPPQQLLPHQRLLRHLQVWLISSQLMEATLGQWAPPQHNSGPPIQNRTPGTHELVVYQFVIFQTQILPIDPITECWLPPIIIGY